MPSPGAWSDMFSLGVPLLEKVLRPVVVYAFLVVGLRMAGKRELAQLNTFDLVVLLTLSNTVQNAIIGNDNSVTGGIVGAATLLFINWLVVRVLYRHSSLDRLLEGTPDVLVDQGQVRDDSLKREMITREELEAAARRQGFASLAEVELAILGPGGGLTFVARRPKPEESRHEELVQRLDRVLHELAELQRRRPGG